jgi:hypothetical protein
VPIKASRARPRQVAVARARDMGAASPALTASPLPGGGARHRPCTTAPRRGSPPSRAARYGLTDHLGEVATPDERRPGREAAVEPCSPCLHTRPSETAGAPLSPYARGRASRPRARSCRIRWMPGTLSLARLVAWEMDSWIGWCSHG